MMRPWYGQAVAEGEVWALSLLVDPQLLRALAGRVGTASEAIGKADVGHLVAVGADGLAVSTTQWMARLVGEHIAGIEAGIANGVQGMAVAVRGAGDRFEVEDGDLATKFTDLF